MAASTKAPDRLEELFAALDHDPVKISGCLVEPILAERLLRERYYRDRDLHRSTREAAAAALQAASGPAELKSAGTVSSVIVLAKRRAGERALRRSTGEARGVRYVSEEAWNARVSGLEGTAGASTAAASRTSRRSPEAAAGGLEAGQPQSEGGHAVTELREAQTFFYAEGLLGVEDGRARIVVARWPKRSFDSWWRETRGTLSPGERAEAGEDPAGSSTNEDSGSITVPAITAAECEPGTWRPTETDLPDPRWNHTAVWTGSEMIVWGGEQTAELPAAGTRTGAIYDPATDTWSTTPVTDATPSPRTDHAAVWTGDEMIVWGGLSFPDSETARYLGDGAAYDPGTDSWRPLSVQNGPSPRAAHTAVWDDEGDRMIVWGGFDPDAYLGDGSLYDPLTDSWTPMVADDPEAPAPRAFHTAVWTGSEMIVWGGLDTDSFFQSGGRYDPGTDDWQPTSTAGAPEARVGQVSVWTGDEMIVWGGSVNETALGTGGRYDPATDAWTPTTDTGAPPARDFHAGVWTGDEMIVWGGRELQQDPPVYYDTAFAYDPAADTWSESAAPEPPFGRQSHTAVWTGGEMIVWGGVDDFGPTATGGRYDPSADSWEDTALTTSAPLAQPDPAGVWTGSELIVWGGSSIDFGILDSGSRFDPATNTWTPIESAPDTPEGRFQHTAVWTGSEMIVWGGFDVDGNDLDTGGRYDPVAGSWSPTSMGGAPGPRSFHTAVWTGSEMVVWGGSFFDPDTEEEQPLDTGGRYDPASDGWQSAATQDAPSARNFHTAVWTGSEMIVWGGFPGDTGASCLLSGGRYDPLADSWSPVADPVGPPVGCGFHTAVWSGSQMILWGGLRPDDSGASGGLYAPASDAWDLISATDEPEDRYSHRAVWTGSEMIVWGGEWVTAAVSLVFDDGAHYDPGDDSWSATGTRGQVPRPRSSHLMKAADAEMLVWGGFPDTSTGGIYCFDCADAVWYLDQDGDGYGVESDTVSGVCNPGEGYAADSGDCDDTDPAINPGAPDLCNGIDDDCDPLTEDGSDDPAVGGVCDGPDGDLCAEGTNTCVSGAVQCSDESGGSPEVCDNGLDDNCDGTLDEATCTTAESLCDADTSGRCDGFDLGDLGRAFGSACGDARYDGAVDYNQDCLVDGEDLDILALGFGQSVSKGAKQ
jgi:N-acetylneuraminic acid mutarotase